MIPARESLEDLRLAAPERLRERRERARNERHAGLHAVEERPIGGIEGGAHRHIPNLWARSEEKIPDGRAAGNSRITSNVAVS